MTTDNTNYPYTLEFGNVKLQVLTGTVKEVEEFLAKYQSNNRDPINIPFNLERARAGDEIEAMLINPTPETEEWRELKFVAILSDGTICMESISFDGTIRPISMDSNSVRMKRKTVTKYLNVWRANYGENCTEHDNISDAGAQVVRLEKMDYELILKCHPIEVPID